MIGADKKYRTPVIGKMLRVLDYLGKQDASFSTIAKALSMPKSSTYVLLQSLEEIGFVRLLPDNKLYSLGFKLYELGTLSVSRISLREQAMPHLEELRDTVDLTCHLGCLQGVDAFYLVKLLPYNKLRVESWEGKRISLYSSGIGKALVAWQKEEEVVRLIASCSLKAMTAKTITDPELLKADFVEARARQWVFDNEEDNLGIRCVAAPIFSMQGGVSAAVSITGPLQQVNDETIPVLVTAVKKAAHAITESVGGIYPDPEIPSL